MIVSSPSLPSVPSSRRSAKITESAPVLVAAVMSEVEALSPSTVKSIASAINSSPPSAANNKSMLVAIVTASETVNDVCDATAVTVSVWSVLIPVSPSASAIAPERSLTVIT